jgi:hypothetical protein
MPGLFRGATVARMSDSDMRGMPRVDPGYRHKRVADATLLWLIRTTQA